MIETKPEDVRQGRMPPKDGPTTVQATPPPEQAHTIWLRRVILVSFWAVVVFLGLPHWIWTTSIHRSNLPLESMNRWADGKACQLHYPIYIRLRHSDISAGDATFAASVQQLLQSPQEPSLYQFHVKPSLPDGQSQDEQATLIQHETTLTVDLTANEKFKAPQALLKSLVPVLEVQYNPKRTTENANLAPFIADQIHKVFADEQNAVSYVLQGSPFASKQHTNPLAPDASAALDARTTRAFKYASTYHLTFSLFTSSNSPSAWAIEEALQETIYPLLEQIRPVSQFTVDTQVQLYASFSPSISGPLYDPATREWQLPRSDWSGFVNAAEWPLSPSIGAGPTINFVLYVPSKDHSPLVLAETGGNSWIIPQWGGVHILNPTTGSGSEQSQTSILSADALRPAMLTFADQLSSLVGLPPSPPSLSLRISSLTRERATSLILSTSSTLGALARLTLKLTSIAIPDSVATSVAETVLRLDQACQHIQSGKYQLALENARIAEEEAEQAFFEPSMVGQVYFPDEHKVAVYVPLLGPMAVPLVLSILKEVRKLRERKMKVT